MYGVLLLLHCCLHVVVWKSARYCWKFSDWLADTDWYLPVSIRMPVVCFMEKQEKLILHKGGSHVGLFIKIAVGER